MISTSLRTLRSFRLLKNVIIGLAIGCAAPSYGLINGQIFLGWENGTFNGSLSGEKDQKISGTLVNTSVFIDPIPLIPIAFGLGATMPKGEFRDDLNNTLAYEGYTFDGEIMVWSPISLSNLTPYAKAGHVFAGTYRVKHEIKAPVTLDTITAAAGGENHYRMSANGNFFSLGLKYSLMPLISFVGEARAQKDQFSVTQVEIANTEASVSLASQSHHTINFMLGVNVGI